MVYPRSRTYKLQLRDFTMKLDINELIHTQVTRPKVDIEDDGRGNFNLSPIGFPYADRSGSLNPTLFVPVFNTESAPHIDIISSDITPLSGLHGHIDGSIVELTAQIEPDENGRYKVSTGVWKRLIEYTYDGTETDNKEGMYDAIDNDGNQLNHFRKGYSHAEVAGFLREKLAPSIDFGKFTGRLAKGNGALYNWMTNPKKTNIGGNHPNQTAFIDSFASILGKRGTERVSYPVDPSDVDAVDVMRDIKSREQKYSKWSLSNHHSEAAKGRNKSPFVRDYPFKYNSSYGDKIFSGGMSPLETHLDEWRVSFNGYSTPSLRPFSDEILFYQRENGYHNNITIDMVAGNMFGRQHISMLHHLDRADVAPNEIDPLGDGTAYAMYRSDLLIGELDAIANKTIAGGYILYKHTVGNVTKYYYTERVRGSVTLSEVGASTWTPSNLLWESVGGTSINVYISETEYVNLSNGDHDIDWLLNVLNENNNLIPLPFTIPVDSIDRDYALKNLSVLFISNSLVDHGDVIHRTEKVRSKKTFVHLPTSVDLMDGQQFELDVSLPMIAEQEPFKFNTLGSLSGYMNYVTQPRFYVFSGLQKCYGSTNYIRNFLKINSLNKMGNTVVVKSNNHGISDTDIHVYLSGVSDPFYSGVKTAVVSDANTIVIQLNANAGSIPTGLVVEWGIRVTDIRINSLSIVDGVATLVTGNQHGIIDAEDILITIDGAANSLFNGSFRAYIYDKNTIMLKLIGPDSVAGGSPKIMGMTVAHAKNFVHAAWLNLPDIDSVVSSGNTVVVNYKSNIDQMVGVKLDFTITGCNQSQLNGEYAAILTSNRTIQYTIAGSFTGVATGSVVTYAFINAGDHGIGPRRILSGEGVEGLTERDNDYLYSVMPEVEGSTANNIYHQHKMSTSDIASSDKRVLLATVYPTSTNTFAWRLDNDPQHKLLRHSIMATTSVYDSAAYQGYLANKNAYDVISSKLGSSAMSLYDSPIAFDDTKTTGLGDSFGQFIASRIRVLMPERIDPTESDMLNDNEINTFGSLVYQMRNAYDDLIDTYYATRVAMVNSSSGIIGVGDGTCNGYNDNGSHSSDDSVAVGFAGLMKFNTVATTTKNNHRRWITKAIYTQEKSLDLSGYTSVPDIDVYSNAQPAYVGYLRGYCTTADKLEANSDSRYIPGQFNSPAGDKYRFGIGYRNSIAAFLGNIQNNTIQSDFAMSMVDYASIIPNNQWDKRDLSNRFMLSGKLNKSSVAAFYGMNYVPVARVFSGDGIIPCTDKLTSMTDFATVTSGSMKSTLVGAISSNPILTRYLDTGINDACATMNSRASNSAVQEYLRNYVVGYATNAPIRFYNSFRIALSGNGSSGNSSDLDVVRAFNYSVRDYVAEYIETLPSALYGRYLDDNFTLLNESNTTVGVVDPNDSMVTFNGRGVSSTAKIIVTDWSELLDGGNAKITINGLVLTAVAANAGANQFVAGVGDVETANNLVTLINSSTASALSDITADNYGGMSNVVLLTVKQRVGADGNSYTLTFTPSSTDNTGIDIVGFAGGVNGNASQLNSLITVAGNPYIADKEFYSRNMRYSYIRVRMRFVFSAMCGRWLTVDYRQSPVTYLTPSIGNEAFAYREKSIVKTGRDGKNVNDYITVTPTTASQVTNKDLVWRQCPDSSSAYRDLWCKTYQDQKPLEFNRFVLPFMSNTFPYDSTGKLLTHDHRNSAQSRVDLSNYRFSKLENPVKNIRMVTPNNIHGGKMIGSTDTSNANLNVFQPNLWSMYWHMRPATSAMDGCDIPSPNSRTGGSPADPTLHNMFSFPCKVNDASEPCYLIPWHEDMHYDWLMNGQPSIDSRIVNYVDRIDKADIDAIYENYNWATDSAIDTSKPVDQSRSDFMEIESDRPVN